MVFGHDYAAPLDVTAHEVTHGITNNEIGLPYEGEHGALSEAISDIFASNIDTEDWEIGEDLPNGAIRDMEHPERFGDPAHVDDYVDTDRDHGGVHTNSGIPNKAYVNMVDRIGRDASERIVYEAVTEHLDSDSGFEDFRSACLRAAADRYGRSSRSTGACGRRSRPWASMVPGRRRTSERRGPHGSSCAERPANVNTSIEGMAAGLAWGIDDSRVGAFRLTVVWRGLVGTPPRMGQLDRSFVRG